ncbi:MAG TPA: hypothetical protein VFY10_09285 [Dehalococcoidia bacterium]|nr:hypothetical protein [Dehalococcoidia bacterium]
MPTRLLRNRGLLRLFALPLLVTGAVAFVAACSGESNNNGASGASASGSNAISSSPTPMDTPATAVISSASPVATSTATTNTAPVQASGAAAPTATPAPATTSLTDLAPCSSETYYTKVVSSDGVPILAYKDVPQGTSILFPFDSGTVQLVDSSANGMTVSYNVPGVGLLTVGTADSEGLERGYGSVTRGQVIGHFNGVYPDEIDQPLPGYQAYAEIVGQQPSATGPTQVTGQPIDPQITACITP